MEHCRRITNITAERPSLYVYRLRNDVLNAVYGLLHCPVTGQSSNDEAVHSNVGRSAIYRNANLYHRRHLKMKSAPVGCEHG